MASRFHYYRELPKDIQEIRKPEPRIRDYGVIGETCHKFKRNISAEIGRWNWQLIVGRVFNQTSTFLKKN